MLHTLAAIGWPVLDRIRIGSFTVSPHGIGIAIGFLTGAWLLGKIGPRRGLDPDHLSSFVFWALIGAIIGARFFYVLSHFSEFENLGQMLAIWRGGISLLGGIAGAVLINLPRVRAYKYRFFQAVDPFAICLALGIAVGRIGDLVIGDHLGRPTSWLLAWQYKGGTLAPPFMESGVPGTFVASLQGGLHSEVISRGSAQLFASGLKTPIASGVGVHQTALYDMLLALVLFGLLWTLNRKRRREGILTLTFGLFYGLCRVLEDSLRIDKHLGPLTGSQWTALSVAIISAGILLWWAVRPGRPPAGAQERDETQEPDETQELDETREPGGSQEPAEEPARDAGT